MEFRGSVRPVVTYASWILIFVLTGYGIFQGADPEKWIPSRIYAICFLINTFWFGERAITNILKGVKGNGINNSGNVMAGSPENHA